MNVPGEEKLDRIADLLREEFELLEKILSLTDEQTALLAEDKVEAFNKSLDKRQALMDKINGLHQESNSLMQSCASFLEREKNAKTGAIKTRQSQIRELLTDISQKNDANIAAAKQMSEQYSEQGNKLSISRKSIGLYAQGVTYSGGNFDSKS